jgi:hypothetical protein
LISGENRKKNMKKLLTLFVLLIFALNISAQKTVVPIVSLSFDDSREDSVSDYGNLLGGVENGKFLDAKTTFSKFNGDTKFSLFKFKSGKVGEFSLGEIKTDSGACPENFYVQPEINAAANFAVGTNANWEILPRKLQIVSLNDANYKKAVADVLRLRGLPKSPVKIGSAYRIDLEGDGREEVILVANHYVEDASMNAKAGSYSFIIIRKTIGGKVQNIFVGGNFLKKKTDYYDGNYSLSGIADLNGDGIMEIIVDVSGYEENWIKVFEMKTGKPTEIKALSYYCGV